MVAYLIKLKCLNMKYFLFSRDIHEVSLFWMACPKYVSLKKSLAKF